MAVEIKVPSVGESVTEAVLAQWFKKDGAQVRKGEPLFVIETDKVTLEVEAEADGVLKIQVAEGETVKIGAVVGSIDTEAAEAGKTEEKSEEKKEEKVVEKEEQKSKEKEAEKEKPAEEKASEEEPAAAAAEKEKSREAAAEEKEPPKAAKEEKPPAAEAPQPEPEPGDKILAPAARRLVKEHRLDAAKIPATGPGGRVTKGDVLLYLESGEAEKAAPEPSAPEAPREEKAAGEEQTTRKSMTPIRRRIADRLLEARRNTAMLTTFNDVDMSRVMEVRSRYKDAFKKRYDVALGFMSFFIKASVEALKEFPEVNAFIEGNEIVYHHYYHIGVAIGTGKGLVVPVIRNAENLGMAEMEQAIVDYVQKVKDNRLDLADLEGGTFTITNGGVFGSLLSTPILNTPQSGILGMHRIEKRPVVIDDEVGVRPMMYLALSYDHRIVDGREAVTFLRRIKEFLENPERMILEI